MRYSFKHLDLVSNDVYINNIISYKHEEAEKIINRPLTVDEKNQIGRVVKEKFVDKNIAFYSKNSDLNKAEEFYEVPVSVVSKQVLPLNNQKPSVTISGCGVLFSNKEQSPIVSLTRNLQRNRNVAKKKRNELLRAGKKEEAKIQDAIQIFMKVLTNSLFGAFGSTAFCLFNQMIPYSITMTSRFMSLVFVYAVESMFYNNHDIDSHSHLDQYITSGITRNIDFDYVSQYFNTDDITHEMLVQNILSKCALIYKRENEDHIRNVVSKLSQESIVKLYLYCNFENIAFDENRVGTKKLHMLFSEYFATEHQKDSEIQKEVSKLLEHVMYINYYHPDLNGYFKDTQKASYVYGDTDSAFIQIDTVMRRIQSKFYGNTKMTENIIKNIMMNMIHLLEHSTTDALFNMCDRMGTREDYVRGVVNFKIEYVIDLLVMMKRKNYIKKVLLQEGIKIPDEDSVEISGSPIRKVTMKNNVSDHFMEVIRENMDMVSKHKNQDEPSLYISTLNNKMIDIIEMIYSSVFKDKNTTWISTLQKNKYLGFSDYKNMTGRGSDNVASSDQATLYTRVIWDNVMTDKKFTNEDRMMSVKLNKQFMNKEEIKNYFNSFGHDLSDENVDNIFKCCKEIKGVYHLKHLGIPIHEEKIPDCFIGLIDKEKFFKNLSKGMADILSSYGIHTSVVKDTIPNLTNLEIL